VNGPTRPAGASAYARVSVSWPAVASTPITSSRPHSARGGVYQTVAAGTAETTLEMTAK